MKDQLRAILEEILDESEIEPTYREDTYGNEIENGFVVSVDARLIDELAKLADVDLKTLLAS